MKRNFNTISSEDDIIIEHTQHINKKICEEKTLSEPVELMDCSDKPGTSADDTTFFKSLHTEGQATLVERNPNPAGYNLVNANYVGKKNLGILSELEQCFENAIEFTQANVRNRIDMIGQQMKYLQNSLCDVIHKAKQDSELHTAACNFVKKPGNMYHLYERPTGQKYFSMLSPAEWNGNPPHLFLGSWFLEADQSWTSSEVMHSRYPGIAFLKEMYMGKKSIQ